MSGPASSERLAVNCHSDSPVFRSSTYSFLSFDGANTRPALISGGFYVGPFYERMGRVTRWKQE